MRDEQVAQRALAAGDHSLVGGAQPLEEAEVQQPEALQPVHLGLARARREQPALLLFHAYRLLRSPARAERPRHRGQAQALDGEGDERAAEDDLDQQIASGQARGQGEDESHGQAALEVPPHQQVLPPQGDPLAEESEQPEPRVDGGGAAHGEGQQAPPHRAGGGGEGAKVHLEPDEEEEDAVDPERGHLPDRADRHLPRGRQRLPSGPAQRQAGRDHRQDGRGVQRFREERRAVGADRREHDLHQVVVGLPQEVGDRVAENQAASEPDRGDPRQVGEAAGGIEAAPFDRGQDGGEGHDRGAVVQEALVFHDRGQPRRHPHLAEARDDGDGVGGGEGGAEQAGDGPPEPEAGMQDRPRHDHGREHAGDGEHGHRPEVLAQPAQVRGERGLVEKDRQEHLEDDLGLEADLRYRPGRAEGGAGEDEGDVVVDAQALGEEADRGRDQQQQQDHGQGAVHGAPILLAGTGFA